VLGGVGAPVPLLGELGDPWGEPLADEIDQGDGDQGLPVRVGRVLQQRQFGGVAEDLVQHVRGAAVGGDDDLGAEGGVLVGDVGVARVRPRYV
jgi:hypothetical protein